MKYNTIAEVFDLGPFITKIILELDQPLTDCKLDYETFGVYVARKDKMTGRVIQMRKSWDSDEEYSSMGERKVMEAYLSDQDGNRRQSSSFITLEMEVDPRIPLGSTISFDGTFNVQVNCEYTIIQLKPITCGNIQLNQLVFDELNRKQTILADQFVSGKSAYQDIHLSYAAFQPKVDGKKRPLLIWLHGAGEGGTDPIIAISGNKVVNLISDDIQRFFGGSYVLAPLSPSMWMDDGTGQYTKDGSSMYALSVKNLIDEYMMSHDDIDKNRIYIGGCSNGGFMTMKMIIAYPQMFAAAFPICEALADEHITADDLNKIKNLPIWFVHATNDPIVNINKYTEATYQRLIEAGASSVFFTCFPSVKDHTGKYFDAEGMPYEYHGHFSWIPALNNECTIDQGKTPVFEDARKLSMFEWLSMQKRD